MAKKTKKTVDDMAGNDATPPATDDEVADAVAEVLAPVVDPSVETAPPPSPAVDGPKVLMSLADMLIAEADRMRADTVPADVQAAVRSLRKWRAK